jgi:hypothetical protein
MIKLHGHMKLKNGMLVFFRKYVGFITVFRLIRFAEDELRLYAVDMSLLNIGITTSFNIYKQLSDAMYCLP